MAQLIADWSDNNSESPAVIHMADSADSGFMTRPVASLDLGIVPREFADGTNMAVVMAGRQNSDSVRLNKQF